MAPTQYGNVGTLAPFSRRSPHLLRCIQTVRYHAVTAPLFPHHRRAYRRAFTSFSAHRLSVRRRLLLSRQSTPSRAITAAAALATAETREIECDACRRRSARRPRRGAAFDWYPFFLCVIVSRLLHLPPSPFRLVLPLF
jgi:hypothetical protein